MNLLNGFPEKNRDFHFNDVYQRSTVEMIESIEQMVFFESAGI